MGYVLQFEKKTQHLIEYNIIVVVATLAAAAVVVVVVVYMS